MVKRLECCITVSACSTSKRLQLNADKTEVLWFGSTMHLRQVSQTRSITVNNNVIQSATVVRDLDVWIDSELSMQDHVSRVAQTCFFHLRHLRSVRRQLGRDVSAKLVSALVLSRLITATPSSRVFRRRHLHHYRESCTQQRDLYST